MANLREWRGLATSPGRWSWRWSIQAAAAAERTCLMLSDEADTLVKLMQVEGRRKYGFVVLERVSSGPSEVLAFMLSRSRSSVKQFSFPVVR